MTSIDKLLDAYWDAAYKEGKDGRTHDTPEGNAMAIRSAIEAEVKSSPIQCEPQPAVTEDGFSEWACPTPSGYLMQCCDCGLIHEVEFRVSKYQPRPSEEFEVLDDPDMQCQFRMRRRDDLCNCKDRPASECPGEWEPGCDLGNNEAYCVPVRVGGSIGSLDVVAWVEQKQQEKS